MPAESHLLIKRPHLTVRLLKLLALLPALRTSGYRSPGVTCNPKAWQGAASAKAPAEPGHYLKPCTRPQSRPGSVSSAAQRPRGAEAAEGDRAGREDPSLQWVKTESRGLSASSGSEVTAQSKRLAEGSPCAPFLSLRCCLSDRQGEAGVARSPSTTSQALELWSPVLRE